MKNKKAHIFAIGLTLLTLIASGYALYGIYFVNSKISENLVAPKNLLDMYVQKERFDFYAHESARLAVHQAFYEAANSAVKSCNIFYSNNIKYSILENCRPQESEKQLESAFNKSFDKFMGLYQINSRSSIKIENNGIKINFENITLNSSDDKGFIKYDVNYTFDHSFTFDMNSESIDDNFEKVYDGITEKFQQCNKSAGNENRAEKIKNCMSEIKFENWNLKTNTASNYVLVELSTKHDYFFENERMVFEPIVLKFALKL